MISKIFAVLARALAHSVQNLEGEGKEREQRKRFGKEDLGASIRERGIFFLLKIVVYYGSLIYLLVGDGWESGFFCIRKLEELHSQLRSLQKQKSDCLKQVLDCLNTLNSLCLMLGMDFKDQISGIYPTLDDSKRTKIINDDMIWKLCSNIESLKEFKMQRLQKLQDLASTMLELWKLMDTPIEEWHIFHSFTCKIAASEQEITEPNSLSVNFINYICHPILSEPEH
ncbi:hypothetical protein Nepgr_019078 [Nepenthes gracilis]|uniref:Uncharacterized protein n=1 Tax=Nepenthes gracilis TaxID=150966 RepID=A0AAD3SV80_NEPGR|nr:hypothetical protein Nepgr_019078 [Nepenthes gracilis]